MPVRQAIYDAAKAALEASTAINYVTREINENPFGWPEDYYPAVRLIDGAETKTRFAYPGSTAQLDMRSEFTLEYVGYVRSLNKSSTELIDAQNNLQAAIETVLYASTGIADYAADSVPSEQMTDRGNLEGIGWITGGFTITYYYYHGAP